MLNIIAVNVTTIKCFTWYAAAIYVAAGESDVYILLIVTI